MPEPVTCPDCKARLVFMEGPEGLRTCPRCLAKIAPAPPPLPPPTAPADLGVALRPAEPPRPGYQFEFRYATGRKPEISADTDIDFDLKGSTWALIALAGLAVVGILATFQSVLDGGIRPKILIACLVLLLLSGLALRFLDDHPLARRLGHNILLLFGMIAVAIAAAVALIVLLLLVCAAVFSAAK